MTRKTNGSDKAELDEIRILGEKMTSYNFGRPYLLIGRSGGCDVSLRDAAVSRKHVIIIRESSRRFRIIDLSSGNGTYVNGERVKSRLIGSEDVIKVGNSVLFFRLSKKKYSSFFNAEGFLKDPSPKKAPEDADTDVDLPRLDDGRESS